LRRAQEHVAMIELPLHLQNVERAKAAFAAPAVRKYLDTNALERIEHARSRCNDDVDVMPRHAHAERLRGKTAASAEGLVAQIGRFATRGIPRRACRLEHRHGTTQIDLCTGAEPRELGREVEPFAARRDE